MDNLKNYEDYYKTLWQEFLFKIKDVDVKKCPEPHLPIYGEYYSKSEFKIAFVGIEAARSCDLEEYNSEDGYSKIIQDWKENDFDSLEYCNWAGQWNFWRFIFQFLGKFYNVDLEELKNHDSEHAQNILRSFVWANTNSIERYHITAEGKNVKYENWKKVKDASAIFDKAENILKTYKPKILLLLNWRNVPDGWFPEGIGEPEENDKPPLRYYYLKNSDTHLYWTKHPRALSTSIGYDVIIYEILQSIKSKNIFPTFPGQTPFELLEKFKKQTEQIAKELKLELHYDPNLGQADSCFYFFKQEWSFGIGFGFDNAWTCDFFGGVCRKDLDIAIPEKIINEIQNKFGMSQQPTRNWPYWFWVEEHRNWNQSTFEEIISGELVKKIKISVEEIMTKLSNNEL